MKCLTDICGFWISVYIVCLRAETLLEHSEVIIISIKVDIPKQNLSLGRRPICFLRGGSRIHDLLGCRLIASGFAVLTKKSLCDYIVNTEY